MENASVAADKDAQFLQCVRGPAADKLLGVKRGRGDVSYSISK